MKVPHKALVLVCDGQRVQLYRNSGSLFEPELDLLEAREQDNPPSREQGKDKPGRLNDSLGNRSAVEITDLHRQAEERFAAEIAAKFNDDTRRGIAEPVILVAPPRMLGSLRKLIDDQARRHVIAELDKDLTGHSPKDVARILADSPQGKGT